MHLRYFWVLIFKLHFRHIIVVFTNTRTGISVIFSNSWWIREIMYNLMSDMHHIHLDLRYLINRQLHGNHPTLQSKKFNFSVSFFRKENKSTIWLYFIVPIGCIDTIEFFLKMLFLNWKINTQIKINTKEKSLLKIIQFIFCLIKIES